MSLFYKYIVNEKVDHIDNVVFGVFCLASNVILNKISIQIPGPQYMSIVF